MLQKYNIRYREESLLVGRTHLSNDKLALSPAWGKLTCRHVLLAAGQQLYCKYMHSGAQKCS